jgi:hypothetical protein
MIAVYYHVDDDTDFWSNTNVTGGYWIGFKNTASNQEMRRVGHWTLPPLPAPSDDPPNYRAPKTLPARQSDKAPLFTVAQMGFWLNQCGRRVA